MTQHIVFGSDHAGYKMKEELKAYIRDVYKGRNEQLFISDIGCNTDKTKSDYPDFAKSLSEEVVKLNCKGVLICGTGIGIGIAANRNPNIRCALCYNKESTEMARLHNNANVMSLGARMTSIEDAKLLLEVFLNTEFEGGRHQRRIDKMN